jgi:hypothetical protein
MDFHETVQHQGYAPAESQTSYRGWRWTQESDAPLTGWSIWPRFPLLC